MLSFLTAWLLITSAPVSTSTAQPLPGDDCEDTRRLELSLPLVTPPRLCISPGTLTGVIFDHPVTVELQDEIRFIEVIRGRTSVAFIPPRDLRPGETLRLTAAMSAGETSQSLTFVLVTHPGNASHQIEVGYRPRSWQSMTDALTQALLANQRLRTENSALVEEGVRLRTRFDQPMGLCGAFDGGQLSNDRGIVSHRVDFSRSSADALKPVGLTLYQGRSNIAMEIEFTHQTPEPWRIERATLINEQGEKLEAIRHRQRHVLSPDARLIVFAEFDPTGFISEQATLRLLGTDGRAITLTHIAFR